MAGVAVSAKAVTAGQTNLSSAAPLAVAAGLQAVMGAGSAAALAAAGVVLPVGSDVQQTYQVQYPPSPSTTNALAVGFMLASSNARAALQHPAAQALPPPPAPEQPQSTWTMASPAPYGFLRAHIHVRNIIPALLFSLSCPSCLSMPIVFLLQSRSCSCHGL